MPAGDDDRSLVVRAQAGDRDAFGVLVRRYQRAVYGFCFRLLGSDDLADDVCQETFVRAWSYLKRFDPARPLRPWLFQIAANRAATRHSREQSHQTAALEDLPAEPAASDDPTRPLEQAELGAAVRRALGELSPQQRQAIVLVELEGQTANEAALVMRCSAATVRQHVFRAKKRLKALLADYVQGAIPDDEDE